MNNFWGFSCDFKLNILLEIIFLRSLQNNRIDFDIFISQILNIFWYFDNSLLIFNINCSFYQVFEFVFISIKWSWFQSDTNFLSTFKRWMIYIFWSQNFGQRIPWWLSNHREGIHCHLWGLEFLDVWSDKKLNLFIHF